MTNYTPINKINNIGKCKICGKDCINLENEYYLKNKIWHEELDMKGKDFLCKECLKKILKRDLKVDDLQVLPINYFNPYLLDEIYSQILSEEEIETMKKANKIFWKIVYHK